MAAQLKIGTDPIFPPGKKIGSVPIFLVLGLIPFLLACKVIDPELQGSYAGPCVNGLAQGEGYATGIATYRGGFKAGRKDGQGVKSWPNGDRYEGEFANDKRNGEGSYRYASGDVYTGEWKDDVPVGAPTPMMLAQRRFREESRKAVAKAGQKVCRAMQVGIAGREWVRGTVVGVNGDNVGVRIDEPGSHGETISGVEIRQGEVIWDAPYDWTPCW